MVCFEFFGNEVIFNWIVLLIVVLFINFNCFIVVGVVELFIMIMGNFCVVVVLLVVNVCVKLFIMIFLMVLSVIFIDWVVNVEI